jgi:hypothetical protein
MAEQKPAPLNKVDPALAWQPWTPDEKQPWNLKWAGHLFRRAAFGTTNSDLRAAIERGYSDTVDEVLRGSESAAAIYVILENAGKAFAAGDSITNLRAWWIYTLLGTEHPLREKMTLFWHNHFVSSITKVNRISQIYNQNKLLRKHALGKFPPFLLEISKDPAMLVYLDSNDNIKGRPNENYAREVM